MAKDRLKRNKSQSQVDTKSPAAAKLKIVLSPEPRVFIFRKDVPKK